MTIIGAPLRQRKDFLIMEIKGKKDEHRIIKIKTLEVYRASLRAHLDHPSDRFMAGVVAAYRIVLGYLGYSWEQLIGPEDFVCEEIERFKKQN